MDTTTTATTLPAPAVWPAVRCADARAEIGFLVTAFGFEEALVVPGQGDGIVVHAELRWPLGGGVMLGSDREPEDEVHARMPSGPVSIYVVTDHPDALFERATAAGAEVVQGLTDTDYGSRGFTVLDPEGNHWSFGTYRGTAS
jgi:uncharacterized glyoxalase superfamily protein PhnB